MKGQLINQSIIIKRENKSFILLKLRTPNL